VSTVDEGIEPAALVMAASEAYAGTRGRHTVLRRNDSGNLAIIADGAYVGFIDLATAEVTWNADYVPPWERVHTRPSR
jgi:hypothetical protein